MDDYYNKYIGFDEDINNACLCINANRCSILNTEVETIKTAMNSINISENWNDGTSDSFISIVRTCYDSLNDITTSISTLFSESEKIYENIKEYLSQLKKANNDYCFTRDNQKPQERDFYTDLIDPNTNQKVEKFNSSAYQTAISNWNDKVNEYRALCEELVTKIENDKTKLNEINGNTLSSNNLSGLSIMGQDVASFLPLPIYANNTVASYVASSAAPLVSYSIWGESFYCLASIDSGEAQETDYCLEWANGYALNMMEKTGVEHNNYPVTFSTIDRQEALTIAANEILNGRAVVAEVQGLQKGAHGTKTCEVVIDGVKTKEEVVCAYRHYVTIYGIKKDADLNNLQESDFIYLDPAAGEVKQLDSPNGGTVQRALLDARAACESKDPGAYCLNIFSDEDYSYFPSTNGFDNYTMIQTHKDWKSNTTLPVHGVNYSQINNNYTL